MTRMMRVQALQSFEVPNLGLFAEGSEYFMAEDTARELQARGIVEFLDTEKVEPEKTGKKGKIVTT